MKVRMAMCPHGFGKICTIRMGPLTFVPIICASNLLYERERAATVDSVLGMWMRSELIEVPTTLYVNHQPPFCPQTLKKPRAGLSQCCKQRASKPGKTPNASRGRQLSNTLSLALVERLDRVFWLVFGQKVSGQRQNAAMTFYLGGTRMHIMIFESSNSNFPEIACQRSLQTQLYISQKADVPTCHGASSLSHSSRLIRIRPGPCIFPGWP